jgi:hypothetical protein
MKANKMLTAKNSKEERQAGSETPINNEDKSLSHLSYLLWLGWVL